jgi:tRNA threonylcarbamoyladenosine biosynthesis protein TsaB
MTLLCIETATKNCSVAIGSSAEDAIVFEESAERYVHAERLHVLLEKALQEATPDAIVVSKGPGSYTGLRIGVAAAKGLSFGLQVPLVSVATLAHLADAARALHPGADRYVSMIDARRLEVYAAVYGADGSELTATHSRILESEMPLDGDVVFAGDGAAKFDLEGVHADFKKPEITVLSELLPSAMYMFERAQAKLAAGETEDPAYFEPFYLKDFVAGKPKRLL